MAWVLLARAGDTRMLLPRKGKAWVNLVAWEGRGRLGERRGRGKTAGREAYPPPTFLRYPHRRKSQRSQIKAQQGPEEAFPTKEAERRPFSLASRTPGPFKLFNASKWVGGASASQAAPRHFYLFKRRGKKKEPTHIMF